MSDQQSTLRPSTARVALNIEVLTIVWMLAEAAIALASGIVARSVVLTAFGLDSVIELVSASALTWRLAVEVRGGDESRVEEAERRASRIAGTGLLVLVLYIVVLSVVSLVLRVEPRPSLLGLAVTLAAAVVMPLLGVVKRRLAARMGSSALRADAAESIACAYLAITAAVGLALNALFGWWWADIAAALLLTVWLVREAREAFEGDEE